jgi:hypothetical protein
LNLGPTSNALILRYSVRLDAPTRGSSLALERKGV